MKTKKESVEIWPERAAVYVDGHPIPSTRKEFLVLYELAKAGGNFIPRDVLMTKIFSKKAADLHTVDQYVCRLRKKLGRGADALVTRIGFGYQSNGIKIKRS